MRPKFPDRIKNVGDVRNFAEYLCQVRKIQPEPDMPFEDYFNPQTGLPAFSSDECEYFNSLMEEAFELCDMQGIDIYEIWHQAAF